MTNYNSLVDQVNQQKGQSGGVLVGDSIIWQISNDMQQLATYWNPSSSGSIHSLSDLGVEFDDTGQMSFNQNTFNTLSQTQISDAFNFLGSSTSGLAALANNFTQITDPIEGLIQIAANRLPDSRHIAQQPNHYADCSGHGHPEHSHGESTGSRRVVRAIGIRAD